MRSREREDKRKTGDNKKISQDKKTWRKRLCYEMTPKKKTISHTFINLIENIKEYNAGKI